MFASSFSGAFVRPVVYILPMCAQQALYDGAVSSYVGGVLRIGGRVLVGLSGAPYGFQSAETAARWCAAGARVIEAERATVDRLTEPVREQWIARKRESLTKRANTILKRAVNQPDEAIRAALIAEAVRCQSKWAGG